MFMSALGAKSAAPLVLKGLVRLTSRILQALRGSLPVRIDPSAAQRLRSGTWVAILGRMRGPVWHRQRRLQCGRSCCLEGRGIHGAASRTSRPRVAHRPAMARGAHSVVRSRIRAGRSTDDGSRSGTHPRCCSIFSTRCGFRTTPTAVSTCLPSLKKRMLGIERTAKRIAVF